MECMLTSYLIAEFGLMYCDGDVRAITRQIKHGPRQGILRTHAESTGI